MLTTEWELDEPVCEFWRTLRISEATSEIVRLPVSREHTQPVPGPSSCLLHCSAGRRHRDGEHTGQAGGEIKHGKHWAVAHASAWKSATEVDGGLQPLGALTRSSITAMLLLPCQILREEKFASDCGLVQPGEEKAAGRPDCSLSVLKGSRQERWGQSF